jgi:hypothetical protein
MHDGVLQKNDTKIILSIWVVKIKTVMEMTLNGDANKYFENLQTEENTYSLILLADT